MLKITVKAIQNPDISLSEMKEGLMYVDDVLFINPSQCRFSSNSVVFRYQGNIVKIIDGVIYNSEDYDSFSENDVLLNPTDVVKSVVLLDNSNHSIQSISFEDKTKSEPK